MSVLDIILLIPSQFPCIPNIEIEKNIGIEIPSNIIPAYQTLEFKLTLYSSIILFPLS